MGTMLNRLNKSVQIDPTFAWTDWELYDMPGSIAVASLLNKTLKDAVNEGLSRREVCNAVELQMVGYAKFGANDTEPRAFLGEVLDAIFNDRS